MMTNQAKDKIYTFRTYADKVNAAAAIVAEQNTDLPAVFNQLLDQIVLTKKIPLKSEQDIQADASLDRLSAELTDSLARADAGEYLTEDEAKKRFGI